MANWCECWMVIDGDQTELNDFYSKVNEYFIKNNFDIVIEDIATLINYKGDEDIRCSAYLDTIKLTNTVFGKILDYNVILMTYQSKWTPCIDEFNTLITSVYPHLSIYTEGIEDGCGVYINTDIERKYFTDNYWCYNYGICESYYTNSESEALSIIDDVFAEVYTTLTKPERKMYDILFTRYGKIVELFSEIEYYGENNIIPKSEYSKRIVESGNRLCIFKEN